MERPDVLRARRAPQPTTADLPSEIIAALKARGLRRFDLRTSAFVSAAGAEARVVLRCGGLIGHRVWTLPTPDAALLAILLRLEPGLRAADLFADAVSAAVIESEARLDAIHALQRSSLDRAAIRAADAPAPSATVH
ncbi:hypothetical protein D3C72_658980 [compost metagenome]